MSASLPRARSLTLLQAQQVAGTLTVFAAFAAGAVSGELGAIYCGLFLALLLGAELARGRFAHRHAALWTVLLFGALLVLALQVFTGALDIVLGAARFALLLCAHRLWNRKTERDELLLLLLSLLLLCAGAALSAELLFGVAFALYAVAGTWALALTHLRFRIEDSYAESRAEAAQAMLHSRRLITPQMLGALGGLSLLALAGAATLFFVFPRVTIGGLHRLAHPNAVAGLTDTIELGGHGAIADDPRVALRARLSAEDDDGAAQIAWHWRARALEIWTGRGWRSRPTRASTTLPHPPFLIAHGKDARKKTRWHTTDLELLSAFSEGVLLVPEGVPINVRFPEPVSARPSQRLALINGSGDLLFQPIEVGDLSYQITTVSRAGFDADAARGQPTSGAGAGPASGARGSPAVGAKADAASTALPNEIALDAEAPRELDPRVRALGEQLAKGKEPAAAAQAVLEYLSRGFRYTRELEDGGPDPIADFLFRRRAGHCELFSSAMVLLLRAGGIPARNVTGYYGGVRMPAGYYAVRAGDAHSWVEVWEGGAGWMLWDPTPASERGSKQDGLWPRAVLLWDSLEARWLSTVVEFDLFAQARALTSLGHALQEAGRRLSGRGTGTSGTVPLARIASVLALAAALFAGAFALRRRKRKAALGAALRPDQLRAQKLWQRARTQLARAGIELPHSLPAREAASHAAARASALREPLSRLVDRYSSARWGTAPLAAAESRALLNGLREALRACGGR